MYPVLEEIWVEILVETVFKLDQRSLPTDFVGEVQFHSFIQLHLAFRRQIDVHDLFAVKAQFEFLVGENEQLVVLSDLADHTPNGQIVQVHLVPVVVLDGIRERLEFVIVQFHFAVRRDVYGTCNEIRVTVRC